MVKLLSVCFFCLVPVLCGCGTKEANTLSSSNAIVVNVTEAAATVLVDPDSSDSKEVTLTDTDDVIYIRENKVISKADLTCYDHLVITYNNQKISVVQVVRDENNQENKEE